jgi:hypothetical protein
MNGAAALAVPATKPAPIEAPIEAIQPSEIERQIGAAMADAAVMIHVGVED